MSLFVKEVAVLVWDVYKRRRSGARLYLSTFTEVYQSRTKDRYIRVIATNTGEVPTTIEGSAFLYYRSWLSLAKSSLWGKPDNIFPQKNNTLPYILKPGDVWRGITVLDQKIEERAKQGLLFFALYASHTKKPETIRVHLN
jgi:hypothetical protein